MIRRFVNLVAEKYKCGEYSLHRLDVSKHLFHQSRADARMVPFLLLSEAQDDSARGDDDDDDDDGQPMFDMWKELPSAMTSWSTSNVDYLSLMAPRCCEEGGILCFNKAGTAVLFDPIPVPISSCQA